MFSALHCQDTQAVCIVCVSSLNSFQVSRCDLCVSFCQTHSDSLAFDLVSDGNKFLFLIFLLQGIRFIVFVRNEMQGEKNPQNTPLLPPCPIGGTMYDRSLHREKTIPTVCIVSLITFLAVCGFKDFRDFQS